MSKLDNKKFMVCCANGAGSSLMMKMTLQKVLTKLAVKPATIHHCSLSEGKSAAPRQHVRRRPEEGHHSAGPEEHHVRSRDGAGHEGRRTAGLNSASVGGGNAAADLIFGEKYDKIHHI